MEDDMADSEPAGGVRSGKGAQPANFGVEIIDVLMRGLANAKDRMASDDPTTRVFCTGFYVDSTHWCPLLYVDARAEEQ
jgi:hypothetical protein